MESKIPFNHTLLASLVMEGFKFAVYVPHQTQGFIYPSKVELAESAVSAMNGYQLRITDREIQEMADGVFEFEFFLVQTS